MRRSYLNSRKKVLFFDDRPGTAELMQKSTALIVVYGKDTSPGVLLIVNYPPLTEKKTGRPGLGRPDRSTGLNEIPEIWLCEN